VRGDCDGTDRKNPCLLTHTSAKFREYEEFKSEQNIEDFEWEAKFQWEKHFQWKEGFTNVPTMQWC